MQGDRSHRELVSNSASVSPGGILTGVVSHAVALIVAVVGAALIVALPAIAIGRIARRRGRRFWPWFVLALGPSLIAFYLRAPVGLVVFWIVVGAVLMVIRDLSNLGKGEESTRDRAVGEEPDAARDASRDPDQSRGSASRTGSDGRREGP
jgi:hypothetical protein